MSPTQLADRIAEGKWGVMNWGFSSLGWAWLIGLLALNLLFLTLVARIGIRRISVQRIFLAWFMCHILVMVVSSAVFPFTDAAQYWLFVNMLLAPQVPAALVAADARRRGYSFVFWFILAIIGMYLPVIAILAALPDRALARRREEELAYWQARSMGAALAPPRPAPVGVETIGDLTTVVGD